jgi:hypothetical protein
MRTVTVSEIAERIRRPHEDLRATGDRIRNWTREGLLVPIGEKNPGTGKVRHYPEAALMQAALIQVIVDCTGVAAVAAGDLLKEANQIFERAKSGHLEDSLLIISKSVGTSRWTMSHVRSEKLPAFLARARDDTHTIVVLSRLFAHVQSEI